MAIPDYEKMMAEKVANGEPIPSFPTPNPPLPSGSLAVIRPAQKSRKRSAANEKNPKPTKAARKEPLQHLDHYHHVNNDDASGNSTAVAAAAVVGGQVQGEENSATDVSPDGWTDPLWNSQQENASKVFL